MKRIMAVWLGLLCAAAWADVSVDQGSVSFSTNVSTRAVTVSYTLSGDADAVVTFDVLTNGTSVGGAWLRRTSGAVCRIVPPGAQSFTWYPDAESPVDLDWADVTVRVDAWALSAPPPYMVADLVSGARRYYETPESLPGDGGVTNVRYKTDCLVMRRIPAKGVQWRMGRTSGEAGNVVADGEAQHYVTMDRDYYIAVFPLTWGQYYHFTSNTAITAEMSGALTLPVTNISWQTVRGNRNGGTAPTDSSFMGLARARLGSSAVDFPTDEQWEYACRACCPAAFANGTVADASFEMGWYSDNSGSHAHPVGDKRANAWGIYDMHGGVWEMCLDGWYLPTEGDRVTASVHNHSTDHKVSRGGSFRHNARNYGRSASRLNRSCQVAQYDQGFRLADEAVAR